MSSGSLHCVSNPPFFGVDPIFCDINRDLKNFIPLFTYSEKKVLLDCEVSGL